MIEITSTEREKATIINTLADVKAPCLFPQRDCYDGDNYKCKECLETMIKWNIQGQERPSKSAVEQFRHKPYGKIGGEECKCSAVNADIAAGK